MNRRVQLRAAAWPWLTVLFCVVLATSCEDGSEPNLLMSPEGKPDHEGVKPPPPPPPPPAEPAIAFKTEARVRSKFYSYLKVMNADGTNITTILTSEHSTQGAIIGRSSWAPDGGSIAFIRSPGQLWLIDVGVVNGVPAGSNIRLLVPRTSSRIVHDPAWSPLGDRIAFSRSYNTSSTPTAIEAVPVTGGEPVQLYWSSGTVGCPTWSPDARRIAFEEDGTIRVLNLDDGGSVTTVLDHCGVTVSWARTQDALAFDYFDAEGYLRENFIMQLPSGVPTLVSGGNCPDWSPDDRLVLFAIPWNGIWTVDVASGITTQLAPINDVPYPVWKR